MELADEKDIAALRRLLEMLQIKILEIIEPTDQLRESAEFELHELIAKKPEMLDSVVVKQTAQIKAEITALKGEADQLGREIEELTGDAPPMAAI